VEIVTHYSNTPDLLVDLRRTLQAVTEPAELDDEPDLPPHPAGRAWRVRDRLSMEDIQSILKEFKAGTSGRELAERYVISLSAVKRLLREHGIRRGRRSGNSP
jgi:hypothetical protein